MACRQLAHEGGCVAFHTELLSVGCVCGVWHEVVSGVIALIQFNSVNIANSHTAHRKSYIRFYCVTYKTHRTQRSGYET